MIIINKCLLQSVCVCLSSPPSSACFIPLLSSIFHHACIYLPCLSYIHSLSVSSPFHFLCLLSSSTLSFQCLFIYLYPFSISPFSHYPSLSPSLSPSCFLSLSLS